MSGLKMYSGFICPAASARKHHLDCEFLNFGMKYQFMELRRIGLQLRHSVVSSFENQNPFSFYRTLEVRRPLP